MALRDIDLAYAAGFFDGEGCVQAKWKPQAKVNKSFIRVTIANTDEHIILWFKKQFGGFGPYIHCSRRGNQPCYLWIASDATAEVFLTAIYPYCRVKRQQVEVALEFRSTIVRTRRKLTEEVVLKRGYLVDRLYCLKHPEILGE